MSPTPTVLAALAASCRMLANSNLADKKARRTCLSFTFDGLIYVAAIARKNLMTWPSAWRNSW